MKRSEFLKFTLSLLAMSNLKSLKSIADNLPIDGNLMPVIFIGHGSPMNGIEDNAFSTSWEELGKKIPEPKAVLVVSAHWLTRGTQITAMDFPKTIHDFGGFPDELFAVNYEAPGDPELARKTASLIKKTNVGLDHDWGLDHGTWVITRRMYPKANIPVLQLSIDYHKDARYHYELASELKALRKKGVLIIGSGNMVHNLRMMAFDKMNEPGFGYDWAHEMHDIFNQKIQDNEDDQLIEYQKLSKSASLAVPTPDHYYPLMYVLGIRDKKEEPFIFNDELIGGSFNMTSVAYGL